MRKIGIKTGRGFCLFLVALICFLSMADIYGSNGRIDILPDGKTSLTIRKPGSYVLVGDVTMSADVSCINIDVDNVTLDLGGHTISGRGGGTSLAAGIYGPDNITVYNGSVNSFGGNGILLSNGACVHDVVVAFNGQDGIYTRDNSHLFRIHASNNSCCGIRTTDNCRVEDCVAEANNKKGKYAGIMTGFNCLVKGCVCRANCNLKPGQDGSAYGIFTQNNCTILDNVCTDNVSATSFPDNLACGIYAGYQCLIRNNTCARNNASGTNLSAAGIYVQDNCIIIDNLCTENRGTGSECDAVGIRTMGGSLIARNTCVGNDVTASDGKLARGIRAGSYSMVQENYCNGNNGRTDKSIGIDTAGSDCFVFKNHCTHHTLGTKGYGILVYSRRCCTLKNTTANNADKGIYLDGPGGYYAENITKDGIEDNAGNMAGSGNRSNVAY